MRNTQQIKSDVAGFRYYSVATFPQWVPSETNSTVYRTVAGDRYDKLADRFYKKSAYWWVLACVNEETITLDTIALPANIDIWIPNSVDDYISAYKEANK